jgi:hypothetical protein
LLAYAYFMFPFGSLWQIDLNDLQQLTDDGAFIDAKSARLAETKEQIAVLQAAVDEEANDLAIRMNEEKQLAAAGVVEDAEAANVRRVLVADVDAVTALSEMQTAAISREFLPDGEQPKSLAYDSLAAESSSLISACLDGVLQAKRLLEEAVTVHDEELAAKREERAKQIKLCQAERMAIEVAHEQRKRYLDDKQLQLDVEHKEVDKARCELLDRQHTMEVLKKEIDEAVAAKEARDTLLKAALLAKKQKQSELTKLNLKSKLKAAAVQAKLASEREVEQAQHTYFNGLVKKQALERDLTAKAEAVAAARDAAGSMLGTVLDAPMGARGALLVKENNSRQAEWIAELKSMRAEVQADLSTSKGSIAATRKACARDSALLAEQHIALSHAKTKLSDYMDNLYLNLPSNPASPRATLTGASKSNSAAAPKSLHGVDQTGLTAEMRGAEDSRKQLFKDGASSPAGGSGTSLVVDVSGGGSPRLDAVAALPSKEVLTTPYAAAHKYLARHESSANLDLGTAPRTSSAELEKITNQLLAEQNHPLYNPDLKVGSEARGWFRRGSSKSLTT